MEVIHRNARTNISYVTKLKACTIISILYDTKMSLTIIEANSEATSSSSILAVLSLYDSANPSFQETSVGKRSFIYCISSYIHVYYLWIDL